MTNRSIRRFGGVFSAEEAFVSVTVVGGGSGESIVINLGNRLLFVQDCCSALVKHRARNRTGDVLRRLMDANPRMELHSILLSHPHLDHFAGMGSLLEKYSKDVSLVGLFAGTTELELVQLMEDDVGRTGPDQRAYQFYKNYGKLLKVYGERLANTQQLTADDSTLVARGSMVCRRSEIPFEVICLAPSRVDASRFMKEARLGRLIELGSGLSTRPRQLCNRVSVVTRITFGRTRILLGGDAEVPSWRQIVAKYGREELASNIFKVSHHGSANGSPPFLLEVASKGRSGKEDTVALVTPSSRHGLPEQGVLERLEKVFDDVVLTVEGAGRVGSVDSVRAEFPEARNITPIPEWPTCSRSVVFGHDGERLAASVSVARPR